VDAATNSEVDRLSAGAYLSLTTFKKDGTAVATPVWVSRDSDRLYVWTEATSGKVKRLRNSGRVLLAPSDGRGALQGAQVQGTAKVLDDPSAFTRVEALHRSKYGWQFRVFDFLGRTFRRRGMVAVEITVP
jgi:uncharacterized protein